MTAKEWNGDLVFLHEARPGAADRSYGVQVAKLAGVPAAVVARAREVLERLEAEKAAPARLDDLPLFAVAAPAAAGRSPRPSTTRWRRIDPDELTPARGAGGALSAEGLSVTPAVAGGSPRRPEPDAHAAPCSSRSVRTSASSASTRRDAWRRSPPLAGFAMARRVRTR